MRPRSAPGLPSVAALVRKVPVRVLDVSRSGCRLESARRLDSGVCGQLVVKLDGRLRMQDVRVARCQAREGAGDVYQVGAELLRTRRLTDRSVRMGVRRFIGEAVTAPGPGRALLATSAPEDLGRRDERGKAVSRAPPLPAGTR